MVVKQQFHRASNSPANAEYFTAVHAASKLLHHMRIANVATFTTAFQLLSVRKRYLQKNCVQTTKLHSLARRKALGMDR